MITVIRTADDLLKLLDERGGEIVRAVDAGDMEVDFARATGSFYFNGGCRGFLHRPPRVAKKFPLGGRIESRELRVEPAEFLAPRLSPLTSTIFVGAHA